MEICQDHLPSCQGDPRGAGAAMLKASARFGARKADKQLPLRPAARAVCKASAASSNAHLGKTAEAAEVVKRQYPLRAFQRQAGHPILNATTQVN